MAAQAPVTGYYEPLLHGARQQWSVPDAAVQGAPMIWSHRPGRSSSELKTARTCGKLVGSKVIPYATRAEIERATAVTGAGIAGG
jgi:membrane-bound lytic murein transglycosylase A